jgi:hypothetical protein
MAVFALPLRWIAPFIDTSGDMPRLQLGDLPYSIQNIFKSVPNAEIDDQGYLRFYDQAGYEIGQATCVQTQWNKERSNSFERLFPDARWGIVLHWFGATLDGDDTLAGYIRGFDGMRNVGGYMTRTSAHFLVGVDEFAEPSNSGISIVQTQNPDDDGTPFVASHLHALDYEAHRQRQQYFVRAFYQLGFENPAIKTILTDFYDGPMRDPNYRTIAIEMTGSDFDLPGNEPTVQQIANALALVCAVMKRYHISILDVFGHHEIELRKSDPGKNFMSLMRYLIGLKAMISGDPALMELVFAPFKTMGQNSWHSVTGYFNFIRKLFVLVGYPNQVYQWESEVNYWTMQQAYQRKAGTSMSDQLRPFLKMKLPIDRAVSVKKDSFLNPSNHEGVDFYLTDTVDAFSPTDLVDIRLVAEGKCLYTGYSCVCSNGYVAIFQHLQEDGAEILTVYGHMHTLQDIKVGKLYRQGHQIGTIQATGPLGEGFLHFAVGYGATWDTVLQNIRYIPDKVQPEWILRRYISPMEMLSRWQVFQEIIPAMR